VKNKEIAYGTFLRLANKRKPVQENHVSDGLELAFLIFSTNYEFRTNIRISNSRKNKFNPSSWREIQTGGGFELKAN